MTSSLDEPATRGEREASVADPSLRGPMSSDPASRLWGHLTGTAAAQVAALGLGATVLAVAARHWSPDTFGMYVITYRALALLSPPVSLSANVAVARYLGRLPKQQSHDYVASVVVGAVLLVLIPVGVVVLCLLLFGQQIGLILYGQRGSENLVASLGMLLVGSCANTIAVSSLQGTFRMSRANVLAILFTGLIPLAALGFSPIPSAVLMFTGVAWSGAAVVLAWPLLGRPALRRVRVATASLFAYGIRRVPGEFAAFGLFALPPVLATSTDGLATGGFVSLAMSLVTLAGASCQPVSAVLLPHMSAEFAGAESGRLARVRRLLALLMLLSVPATLVLFAVAPTLLIFTFGQQYAGAAEPMRVACIGVPAFCGYVATRSIVDAYHDRPVTMRYALVAFAAFAVAYVTLHAAGAPSAELVAFDVGVWTLASLTVRRALQLLQGNTGRTLPVISG